MLYGTDTEMYYPVSILESFVISFPLFEKVTPRLDVVLVTIKRGWCEARTRLKSNGLYSERKYLGCTVHKEGFVCLEPEMLPNVFRVFL